MAVRVWRDPAAADRLRRLVGAIAEDGGVVGVDGLIAASARAIAVEHDLSTYDAAYVAAARATEATLVSCDVRDLVSRGLAVAPSSLV